MDGMIRATIKTLHISREMYMLFSVINMVTQCFQHRNTVFPAQKHRVSIFVIGTEHHVNQIVINI